MKSGFRVAFLSLTLLVSQQVLNLPARALTPIYFFNHALNSPNNQFFPYILRQEHRAGEKMFVDYAGQTVPIVNPSTGEVNKAYIFGAVLGASNYTYAEASPAEDLPSWIKVHIHAFEFF